VRTEYIDKELPFSEEEFYRAFRLVELEGKAREEAAFIGLVVREANEQGERARLALAAGSQDRSETAVPTWIIPDAIFALLALVSDDLRVRVDAYMRAQREGEREHLLRNRLYRPGGVILRAPTPEVYAEVEAHLTETEAEWNALLEKTAEWVRRQQAGEAAGDEPPPWPGQVEGAE
jgi:hypothetical protein